MDSVKINQELELDYVQLITMNKSSLLDPEEFRRQGHIMVYFLADYFQNIDNYPVHSQVEPATLVKSPKNMAFGYVVDYKDWQITLSRRFRSIKLWLVLRTHGVANLGNFIRNHIKMAKHFEGHVAMDDKFKIIIPRNFSMVCFRVSPLALLKKVEYDVDEAQVNEFNEKLLEFINSSGKIHMTDAAVGGTCMIGSAIGAPLTDYPHIDTAWDLIWKHVITKLES
ncbi:hypothetical protein HAX54_042972 [Datura stramonium]|uniref:Uncharacterized protein n=1 Tax=Datura stramonium TaxID=4076 RepID=A0ABS8SMH9_DATST|nr:hypothetical protein [Datura stramonium]